MQQTVGQTRFSDGVKLSLRPRFNILKDDDDDTEVKDEGTREYLKPWSSLPYNFLVSTCRYLHDRDRYTMAQVCRRWREATLNPSLWRSHVFYLYCRHEAPQGLAWLTGRASFLRHASIMCFGSFDKHREQFLRALQQTDLLDLDINGAAYWWSSSSGDSATVCSRVVARIARLVKTQRRLRGFQMRQAMLPFSLGVGVLTAVLVASGQSLERLGLEDFFGEHFSFSVPYMPERFTLLVCQFPNLSELTINYEYLTDGLLEWLAVGGKDRTIRLNLVSWLTSSNRPGVSKDAWATLANSKRDVRVYLILQNIRSISEVRYSILRPEIPMHRLDLIGVAALERDETEHMVDLLQHIASSYGDTLTGLRLWSDNYICDEIENSILNLLRKSPKLVYLDLHMEVRCQIIATLCDMQKSHVINLQTLRLARSLTNFLEFEQFRVQVRSCFPVLKELGLDFHVRAESAPDHSARNEYVFIIADNAGIMDSEDENYLACVGAASTLSSSAASSSTSSSSSTVPAAAASLKFADNHNNSNANAQESHPADAFAGRRIWRRRDSRLAISGVQRSSVSAARHFRFQWRPYRVRRDLRHASRTMRKTN